MQELEEESKDGGSTFLLHSVPAAQPDSTPPTPSEDPLTALPPAKFPRPSSFQTYQTK